MSSMKNALIAILMTGGVALAQQERPPEPDGPRPRPEDRRPPIRDERGGGGRGGFGGGPGGGPGGGFGGGGGLMRDGMGMPGMQLEAFRGYMEAVERYVRLAQNPVASGVAAVVGANDILKARGTDAAVEYFTKLLPEVKNDAVKRAIRLQLMELHRAAGQQDKALEQLRELMTGVSAGDAAPPQSR